jgi:hypothetical protein
MNCRNMIVFVLLLIIATSSCSKGDNSLEKKVEDFILPNSDYYHQNSTSTNLPSLESQSFGYDSQNRLSTFILISKGDTINRYRFFYSPFRINGDRTKFENVVLNQKGYIQEMMMTDSIEEKIYHSTYRFTYDSSDRLIKGNAVLITKGVHNSITYQDTIDIEFVAEYSDDGALMTTKCIEGTDTDKIRFEYNQPFIPNTKNQYTMVLTYGSNFRIFSPFLFAGLMGKPSAFLPSKMYRFNDCQIPRDAEVTYDFNPDGSIKTEKLGRVQKWEYK